MHQLTRLGAQFVIALVAMVAAFAAGHRSADRSHHLLRVAFQSGPRALLGEAAHLVRPTVVLDGEARLGGSDAASPSTTEATKAPDTVDARDFSLFWEALAVVQQRSQVEPPDPTKVTHGAIRGSLQALQDPFTVFSDPVDAAVQRPELEGQFEGIGAYVTASPDGRLMIQTPMRGQPAEKAGVRAGDIVIKVDDLDIVGMDLSEAVLLIRGPKGTEVRLTILRDDVESPIVITVVRDKIDIPSVNSVTLLSDRGAPEVGYLQLTVFAAETRDELTRALAELRAAGARAIVLDLRDNPGGFLNTAMDVASEFINDGVLAYQEDNRGRRTTLKARSGGSATDVPLAVLVNRGSASASEIVAGAIRDHGRGVLVGQGTFGKGSVQNMHRLSDGSELRVTVAVWLTPNGTLIHMTGIEPDVLVAPPGAPGTAARPTTNPEGDPPGTSADAREDPELERAIVEVRRLMEPAR